MMMLKIDEKWSVSYDPKNNDRPVSWYRYNELNSAFEEDNAVVAMFYALLAAEKQRRELEDLRMFCKGIANNIVKMLK